MNVKAIVDIQTRRGIIRAGTVFNIPDESLDRLCGKVEVVTADLAGGLWQWYATEADRVYRSFPKSADTWRLCKDHENAAERLCGGGSIAGARQELEKALAALQGATVTQQTLIKGARPWTP